MIAFHIDMNMAQHSHEYLSHWLKCLAQRGYDTILWEVENSIAWETCPECASPDAFGKDEFRDILAESRALGLEPIPLLQTIAHGEYVLKHPAWEHLREIPDDIYQYCPTHPELMGFLHQWLGEYLELFGEVRQFHIGADEAWSLGSCPRCKAYCQSHSLSDLFIDHVNAVAEPLIRRGVTPILWADMVLHRHEAIDKLSRDILLFDWVYSIYHGSGEVQVWGEGTRTRQQLSPETLAVFGEHIFPHGDEPGREPETFYTADFLADKGFRVVGCPASSSYGDNVFAPRSYLHLANTFDWCRKTLRSGLDGMLLTSWSVHLFPWELQLACIDVPGWQAANPAGSLRDFEGWFIRERFGTDDSAFWAACGLLSKSCLFTHTSSLGFSKSCLGVPDNHVAATIRQLGDNGGLDEVLASCRQREQEYRKGLAKIDAFTAKAIRGREILAVWQWAGRNLLHRAAAAAMLLEQAESVLSAHPLSGAEAAAAGDLLCGMRTLRSETEELLAPMIRPTRRAQMVAYMYEAIEDALAALAGERT